MRFNGSTFDDVFCAADRAGFATAFFFAGFVGFADFADFAVLDLATIFADFVLDFAFFFAAFAIIEAPFAEWLRRFLRLRSIALALRLGLVCSRSCSA
ncbi:MAG: hypothetical protein DMG11_17235 [Acidobacteria bacterium]|nr:MAG: hypothetical protein DMG11_17235 [Acidobacteriota bacterium]